jgi:hypothetical protein
MKKLLLMGLVFLELIGAHLLGEVSPAILGK